MGNACAKNAPEQVKEPAAANPPPELDTDDLDELERMNERLRQQKRELEEELARWRQAQQEKMDALDRDLEEVQKESAQILSAGATSGEVRELANKQLVEEMTAQELEEKNMLENRRDFLKQQVEEMKAENVRLEDLATQTETAAHELEDVLQQLDSPEAVLQEESPEGVDAARLRRLGMLAEYYRPVKQPGSVAQCWEQTRVDCAECSSQTVRNLKALAHHWMTGDDSWYVSRPIRGVICNSLKMGNVPHDPWTCDLCDYLDISDIPIFV
ncbi:hypothetical protein GNI_069100 [Gregarina niphandrodes]|uniref:Uncharacterized protein n=1 Tax=Gregarina niphandrodes TaxID=110365 RepID=A0A023B7G4_GRENI|nr:hypothetical protein GNI_069100 [Gregarina niphandrodes]EZG67378.1 hypothetical protein GNI_069100 [Gregarina niphandrodes]|eukprot:XP_011130259.1 hypothetical protein GNI_069100 [Gregarina niphandrodes]